MENKIKIIQNAIKTPDGKILYSKSVHDFQQHIDKDKVMYFVDGGLDYIRYSIPENSGVKELFVYSNTPFKEAREKLLWGTYGINGDEELKYVTIEEMSTDHIKNVLKNVPDINEFHKKMFELELLKRKNDKGKE